MVIRRMQSTAQLPIGARDASTRWASIWHAAYFGALALASLVAARPQERAYGMPLSVALALAAVAAGWHFVAAVRRPAAHRRTKPTLLWAIGAVLLNSILVAIAPVYLFAASFHYAQIFQLMPVRAALAAISRSRARPAKARRSTSSSPR
jgi:hypothetical protein